MESHQHAGHNARQKDQQNLNRTLTQLQAYNDRLADFMLKRETGRAGAEDQEAISTAMQERLNHGQRDDVGLRFCLKAVQHSRPVEVPRWTIGPFGVERVVTIDTG